MDQLRVLGLDLALRSTGAAKAVGGALGGDPEMFRITTKLMGYRRMQYLISTIGNVVKDFDPALVMIEGPALYGKGSHHHEAAGLWWHITYRLWAEQRPFAVVVPQVLKKYATGKGNADKVAMCVAAANRFRLTQVQDDEADALWLAAAGCQHYGMPVVALPQQQITVLDGYGKGGKPVIDWPSFDRVLRAA